MDVSDPETRQYDSSALAGMRALMASSIVSFFIESLLCGAFTVTYATGTWALLRIGHRGTPRKRDWIIFGASTTMFCLAFAHLALTIKSMLLSFVEHSGSIESVASTLGFPSEPYNGNSLIAAIFIAKFAIFVTQTLIGDAFMLYRLYVIWDGRKKVLAAPALLFLVSLGTGYGSVYLHLELPMIFSAFSFFNNVLFTVLVMWRILCPKRWAAVPSYARSRRFYVARKATEAIVQSAAIYSVASAALVISFFLSSNVGWTACLNVFPPLIGLVFSFIVKRIARRAQAVSDLAETSVQPPACTKAGKRPNITRSPVASPLRRPCSLELISLPIVDDSNETLPDFMATVPRGNTESYIHPHTNA
ncbi:hypothetical protein C8Q73DRAFT_45687 [Cubamyces lactineus]|nr:hypothetical protein C8Q73DRAFT_45687 [Cubamyces lactineus]